METHFTSHQLQAAAGETDFSVSGLEHRHRIEQRTRIFSLMSQAQATPTAGKGTSKPLPFPGETQQRDHCDTLQGILGAGGQGARHVCVRYAAAERVIDVVLSLCPQPGRVTLCRAPQTPEVKILCYNVSKSCFREQLQKVAGISDLLLWWAEIKGFPF